MVALGRLGRGHRKHGRTVRRGERSAWREIAASSKRIAEARGYAEEYTAKIELRSAWARLNGIEGVAGIPRSGARP